MGEKNNKDIGVSKDWIIAVLEQNLTKPKKWTEKDVEQIAAAKPKSRLQELIVDVYEGLLEAKSAKNITTHFEADGVPEIINLPDEDFFDKWYENNELEDYPQKYKFGTFLNRLAARVGKTGGSSYSEEGIQETLSKLVNAVMEDQDAISIIAETINTTYPRLAQPPMAMPQPEKISEYEQTQYDKQVDVLRESVESNIDQYQDLIQDLKSAAKTDFEEMAYQLNQIVIFGEACWELILYSIMSPKAPRILINGLDYRANLHTLLEGDISTAKSKILEIAKIISPKMVVVDETTKASLEGVALPGNSQEIADGVIDIANAGNIIIEEFNQAWAKMSLFRRIMDGKRIQIFKKGIPKTIDVNTTIIAACNPEEGFFHEDQLFRDQIVFKEGILSRFDIQIPLTATTTANKILVDRLNLFGEAEEGIDLDSLKRRLELIAFGMGSIKRVRITGDQLNMIRDVFKEHNETDHRRRILKWRPLILLRDLETLARLVNIIVSVNFNKRKVDNGILYAEDEDVEKAIRLWENLLYMRIQLYANQSRLLKSPADEIVLYIVMEQQRRDGGEVPIAEVYTHIVEVSRMISRATFYREVERLRSSGRIIQNGLRDSMLKVIIE